MSGWLNVEVLIQLGFKSISSLILCCLCLSSHTHTHVNTMSKQSRLALSCNLYLAPSHKLHATSALIRSEQTEDMNWNPANEQRRGPRAQIRELLDWLIGGFSALPHGNRTADTNIHTVSCMWGEGVLLQRLREETHSLTVLQMYREERMRREKAKEGECIGQEVSEDDSK